MKYENSFEVDYLTVDFLSRKLSFKIIGDNNGWVNAFDCDNPMWIKINGHDHSYQYNIVVPRMSYYIYNQQNRDHVCVKGEGIIIDEHITLSKKDEPYILFEGDNICPTCLSFMERYPPCRYVITDEEISHPDITCKTCSLIVEKYPQFLNFDKIKEKILL